MRILITGATGFAGWNLAHALIRDGHQVSVAGRDPERLAALAGIGCSVLELSHAPALVNALATCGIQVILHLATLFRSSHVQGDVLPMLDSNVCYGANLLDCAVRAEVQTFVNVGTTWQHFGGSGYSPSNLYAATKQAFQDILKYYVDSGKISSATICLGDSYGPNDHRPKLLNLWKRMLGTGELMEMSGGDQLMDLLYVSDLCDGFAQLLVGLDGPDLRLDGREYNLRSGRMVSLRELANLIQHLAGKPLNLAWGVKPYRDREIMVPHYGGEDLPGWRPQVPLEVGLRLFLEV